MDNFPKVSIITYAYVSESNGRYPLLLECIESIRDQSYPNYEHIIIDDGSDKDLSHLEIQYPNIRYFKKPGTGIISSTYTFNLGYVLAEGKYCILLPSDDLQMLGALHKMVEALEAEPNASMAIGRAINEYIDGRIITWSPDKDKIENNLHEGNYVNGCAAMWKRSKELDKRLPPNYTGFCCDYDIFATIAKLGTIVYPDCDVVKYRHVDDSTRNKTRSSFIVSSRKEDKNFYQYSKPSRVEFVKIRCNQDLERLLRRPDDAIDINNLKKVKLDVSIPPSIIKQVQKRNWTAVDCYFESASTDYSSLKRELNEYQGSIVVEELNISACSLMRQLTSPDSIYVSGKFDKESWIIDYLPLPYLRGVLNENAEIDIQLSSYIGL